MAIDKDTEALSNISAPLGTLDHLQAQSQEQMAAPARIPLIKWLGYTPSGLNASTSDDIRTFYDSIHGRQERVYDDILTKALKVIQLSEWGFIDDELYHEFNPLWQLDEAGQAAVRKTDADTASVLITGQMITPDEGRKAMASGQHGPWAGLEGDAPEPEELPDEHADLNDPSERVDNQAEEGSEAGANSGV